jgi:uncharacterized protein YdaU (DUF1376 family)
MRHYSHHIGDFDRATRHLSRIERSVYRDLLDVYYDTEQMLTLDVPTLCRKIIARSPEEVEAVKLVLSEFFHETPTGWFHDRCEEEIAAYRRNQSQAAAAGKASAAARAARRAAALTGDKPQQPLNDNPTPVERPLNAGPTDVGNPLNDAPTNRKPVTVNQSKPKPSSSSGDDGVEVKPFDQFWAAYPHRVAKIAAQKAWAKLKPNDELVAVILAAIEAQKEGWHFRHENGRYIPHPASWLNAGCWLDEVRPYTPPPLKLPAGWWESSEGMKAAGAMLTPPLTPNKGEYPREFAARIRAALGQIDAPQGAAPAAPAAPEPYIPPAPPADVILTDEQREARREEFREQLAKLRGAAGNLPIQPRNQNSEVPA